MALRVPHSLLTTYCLPLTTAHLRREVDDGIDAGELLAHLQRAAHEQRAPQRGYAEELTHAEGRGATARGGGGLTLARQPRGELDELLLDVAGAAQSLERDARRRDVAMP